jgi:hypothetical protein
VGVCGGVLLGGEGSGGVVGDGDRVDVHGGGAVLEEVGVLAKEGRCPGAGGGGCGDR